MAGWSNLLSACLHIFVKMIYHDNWVANIDKAGNGFVLPEKALDGPTW